MSAQSDTQPPHEVNLMYCTVAGHKPFDPKKYKSCPTCERQLSAPGAGLSYSDIRKIFADETGFDIDSQGCDLFGFAKAIEKAALRAPQADAIAALHTDLAYYQAKWENELSTVSKIERERDALREEVSRLISATLYVPKYQWQWCLNGEWNSVVFNVVSAPNAFNRLMQKWILGIHWRKIK